MNKCVKKVDNYKHMSGTRLSQDSCSINLTYKRSIQYGLKRTILEKSFHENYK